MEKPGPLAYIFDQADIRLLKPQRFNDQSPVVRVQIEADEMQCLGFDERGENPRLSAPPFLHRLLSN